MVISVPLRHANCDGVAVLRPPCGTHELSVSANDTAQALALLDALLEPVSWSAVQPGRAGELVAADRDRLLAAVYRSLFGGRVVSTLICSACGQPFDTSFDLAALEAVVQEDQQPDVVAVAEEDGWYAWSPGVRFRLPTGVDECAVAHSVEPGNALLSRCVQCLGSDTDLDTDGIEQAMEALAPLLDRELDAQCPECGAANRARFTMQDYLLDAALGQRDTVLRDMHVLASSYSWTPGDILELERTQRRRLVAFASGEAR